MSIKTLCALIIPAIIACISPTSYAMGSLPETFYHNPILEMENLADPHMIKFQGKYYLYGTFLDGSLKGGSDHYDVYVSDDMTNWEKTPNIFSKNTDTLWAPDVFYDASSSTFYLYYSESLSIGVATSNSPTGPFIDKGILIENAIDAHMFYDNGEYYLYYSSTEISDEFDMIFRFINGLISGTNDKARENILVQKMRTPTEKMGDAILLIEPDAAWEKGIRLDVAEGAWMFKNDNTYYLMYSGNEAMFGTYAVGYATSDNPLGPFVKAENNPIVHTRNSLFNRGVYSPGHHSVLTEEDGTHWIIYHQKKTPTSIGFSHRFVCKDEMFVSEEDTLHAPSTGMRTF
ncbi:MAG: glycoside hydrolase family 43 protein [Pseudomonadales bacterium]|nr:glycoside hydrolase family 43 protein [Pseudomonadales bacterium]